MVSTSFEPPARPALARREPIARSGPWLLMLVPLVVALPQLSLARPGRTDETHPGPKHGAPSPGAVPSPGSTGSGPKIAPREVKEPAGYIGAPKNSAPGSSNTNAAAEASPARLRATRLLKKGNTLRKARRFPEALQLYQAAYTIFPSYKILLNMGLTLHDMGRLAEAAAFLERFAARGAGQSPRQHLNAARNRLQALKKKLARIWISCPVAGAKVNINGRAVGFTPLARWIYLRPGDHRVILTRKNFRTSRIALTLGAGELKDLAMNLKASNSPNWETDVLEIQQAHVAITPEQRARNRRSRRLKSLWGYSALGAGLGCLTAGGVLFGLGFKQGAAAQDDYNAVAGGWPPSSGLVIDAARRDKRAARDMVTAGTVLLGVGVGAAVFSIYQLLTRPERPSASGSAELSPRLSIQAGGQGARLSIRTEY